MESLDSQAVKGLISVAMGREPADTYIENGRILSVYTGEVLDGQGVAVKGGRVACVGPSRSMVGKKTRVIDAGGKFLVPGYIDAHAHADLVANPLALARAVAPLGTTAVLTDTHELVGALGSRGIDLMLDLTEGLPVRFYLGIPAANPPNPEIEGGDSMDREEFLRCLAHPRVLAVSEVTAWPRVAGVDPELVERLAAAAAMGKRVEGHGAGCSHDQINALAVAGTTSCHESISMDDLRRRLNLGLYAMARHGSIRRDLENICRNVTGLPSADSGRVILTPDWMSPRDIVRYGYMDHVIGEAIRMGVPPAKAYRMATLTPATYLGLDRILGGIAPGRLADINFLGSLEDPRPEAVMAGGTMVGEGGRLLEEIAGRCPALGPEHWRPGRTVVREAVPAQFGLSDREAGQAGETVPVIRIVSDTITGIDRVNVSIEGGRLGKLPGDVIRICMIASYLFQEFPLPG